MELCGYDYKDEKIIFANKMDKEDCIKLYNIAKENNIKFVMNTYKGRVVTKLDGSLEDELLCEPIETFLEETEVMQCLLQDKNFELIKSLKEEIEKIDGVGIKNQSKSLTNQNISPTNSTYYDIADKITSKGYGVKKICESLNLDTKEVISIGDDYNDLTMFAVTGYSVAMGNANDEIKSKAKEVTATNNEDGVAIFLEKLIRKNIKL